MKVLRSPPKRPPMQVECIRCKALLEVEEKDCTFRFDQREGDALVCPCPCCKEQIWIAAKAWNPQ